LDFKHIRGQAGENNVSVPLYFEDENLACQVQKLSRLFRIVS